MNGNVIRRQPLLLIVKLLLNSFRASRKERSTVHLFYTLDRANLRVKTSQQFYLMVRNQPLLFSILAAAIP
jgi:hypothetical protein